MEFYKIPTYREFIRFYLSKRSRAGRGEITKLAEALSVHTTFVSKVLSGSKDFNSEQSFTVTQFLNLTEPEKKYFLLLVQKDRAGSRDLKAHLENELSEFRSSYQMIAHRIDKHRSLSDEDRAVFYSSWIYSAIRLYTSINGGKTEEEICAYFELERKRTINILDFLCEKNLIIYENNRYRLGDQHTHLPNNSPFVVRHHMNWRVQALQRHDNLVDEEIAFTAPMSLAKKDFGKIRELILNCLKESIDIAKESSAEELAFLNIDWLWLKK